MSNQLQRKLHTRLIILKKRLLNPKSFFKILTLLVIVFLFTPIFLYVIIYNGYSQKLITSTDSIRDELTTGVLISDGNQENFKSLADLAKDAYQKRKISFIYIYLIGDSQNIIDENVLAAFDKVPPVTIKIERSVEDPQEVCDSTKDVYNLSKFLILSYRDTAIRSNFICNNLDIFTQALVPSQDESTLPLIRSSVVDYLKDIVKVFTGLKV